MRLGSNGNLTTTYTCIGWLRSKELEWLPRFADLHSKALSSSYGVPFPIALPPRRGGTSILTHTTKKNGSRLDSSNRTLGLQQICMRSRRCAEQKPTATMMVCYDPYINPWRSSAQHQASFENYPLLEMEPTFLSAHRKSKCIMVLSYLFVLLSYTS